MATFQSAGGYLSSASDASSDAASRIAPSDTVATSNPVAVNVVVVQPAGWTLPRAASGSLGGVGSVPSSVWASMQYQHGASSSMPRWMTLPPQPPSVVYAMSSGRPISRVRSDR